ncbi:hypothetical protein GW17_00062140, partial [Ensete ventricosum]
GGAEAGGVAYGERRGTMGLGWVYCPSYVVTTMAGSPPDYIVMAHLHHHGRCSTNPDRDATKPAVVQSGVIQGDHATVVEVLTGDAGGGGVKSNGRVDVYRLEAIGVFGQQGD